MKIISSVLRLVESYNKYTEQNPAKSIILSTGFLFGAGDLLTQQIDRYYERKEHEGDSNYQVNPINKMRIAHMCLYGLTFMGPFSYVWYTHALPKIAPITIEACKSQLFKKIAIDQVVGSGIQYSSFLVAMTLLGGQSISENSKKIKEDFVQCCISDVFVWPWVQFLNFRYVPIHMQALYVNFVSVFWNAYISAIHHTPVVEKPSLQKESNNLYKGAMLAF
ncbi:hypothetical protein ABPG72_001832 [Tetrahymena utriculariae]